MTRSGCCARFCEGAQCSQARWLVRRCWVELSEVIKAGVRRKKQQVEDGECWVVVEVKDDDGVWVAPASASASPPASTVESEFPSKSTIHDQYSGAAAAANAAAAAGLVNSTDAEVVQLVSLLPAASDRRIDPEIHVPIWRQVIVAY